MDNQIATVKDEHQIKPFESYDDPGSLLMIEQFKKIPNFFLKLNYKDFVLGQIKTNSTDGNSEWYLSFGPSKPSSSIVWNQQIVGPPLCCVSANSSKVGDYKEGDQSKKITNAKHHFDLAFTATPTLLEKYPVLEWYQAKFLEFVIELEKMIIDQMWSTKNVTVSVKAKIRQEEIQRSLRQPVSEEERLAEEKCRYESSRNPILKNPSEYCCYHSVDFKKRICIAMKTPNMPDPFAKIPNPTGKDDHINILYKLGFIYDPPLLRNKAGASLPLGRNYDEMVNKGSFWLPTFEFAPFTIQTTSTFGVKARFRSATFFDKGDPDHVRIGAPSFDISIGGDEPDEFAGLFGINPVNTPLLMNGSAHVNTSNTGIFSNNTDFVDMNNSNRTQSSNSATNEALKKRALDQYNSPPVQTQPAKKTKLSVKTNKTNKGNEKNTPPTPKKIVRTMRTTNTDDEDEDSEQDDEGDDPYKNGTQPQYESGED